MPVWSKEQEEIFSFFETIHEQSQDLVIEAYAGCAKTTTAIQAIKHYHAKYPKKRILMAAFNKKNADELTEKINALGIEWKQAHAKTLNSVGLACHRKNSKGKINVEPRKGRIIAKALADAYNGTRGEDDQISGLAGKVRRLVELAKATLTWSNNDYEMRSLCWEHMISCDVDEVNVVIDLARKAMDESTYDPFNVDFTDMIWFPYRFKQWPWQYDLVIIDEAQDQNAAMLSLAQKSKKRNGKLVIIGDRHQAIYGWRGADSEFMQRATEEMGAKVLTLSQTFRCGKAIVAEVAEEHKLVPGFTAHKDNCEGLVRHERIDTMIEEAVAGDFIISRKNADLMQLCIEFLKDGRAATIQGRDIMGALIGIINDSEAVTTPEFLSWLEDYRVVEAQKLELLDAEEKQIDAHYDRCECLRVLSVECDTTQCLIDKLEELFSDDDDENKIVLTTAHRSKGLERDRVWLLIDSFRADRGGQEANCLYVAITRAKEEVVYVG